MTDTGTDLEGIPQVSFILCILLSLPIVHLAGFFVRNSSFMLLIPRIFILFLGQPNLSLTWKNHGRIIVNLFYQQ